MDNLGDEIMLRLEEISKCSTTSPGVTRLPFTSEHKSAIALLTKWMKQAGLSVHLDDAGTLIGRREGAETTNTLLLGSHQDSVPQGGKYDGILGVVLPIVVIEALKDEELPISVEVLAFADEEGVRFPTALIGPRALAGTFDENVLSLQDKEGITIETAIKDFGLDPSKIASLKRNPSEIIGYIETHIEQGPVLQHQNCAVGIVNSICGIERWSVSFHGCAAHAGTTPAELRKDALAGAAEIVLEVERQCRQVDGLMATVGELNVIPNAVNAVPGEVNFLIELRSGDNETRRASATEIIQHLENVALKRNIRIKYKRTYSQSTVQSSPEISNLLKQSGKSIGADVPMLVSGATHDASAIADLTEMSMLFVRCRDGISHHSDESITSDDADITARVLSEFLTSVWQ